MTTEAEEAARMKVVNLSLLRKLADARKEALMFAASLCDETPGMTGAQLADRLRQMAAR